MGDWIRGAEKNIFRESGLVWRRSPNIIVAHTTETANFPSKAGYKNGNSAPHITTHPRKRATQQHYPFSRPAYALLAPAGISTNSMGTIQVEIIGTCNDALRSAPHSVYSFTDGDLQYLADIFGQISDETGIPLQSSVKWETYPKSYGLNNGLRLSRDAFYNYRGVLGHQHVPGNSHGDPGNFIPKVLDLANGKPVPEEEVENNMLLVISPKLGGAVIDGGWYRALGSMTDVESYEAAGLKRRMINDEQHAIIRDNSLNATYLDNGLSAAVIGGIVPKFGEDGPATLGEFVGSILHNVKAKVPGNVEVNVERLSDEDVNRIVDGLAARLSPKSE